jgi:4-hydroxy-2-oxoglutarate aldolase
MRSLQLNGILPPVTTPFDEAGNLDYRALERNISRYNEAGLAGYVALGSNGEAVHLTAEERLRVIESVRRAAAPGHTVIAGINELSTRAAIEATRAAEGAGAAAALLITPYYYKSRMTQEALARYFSEVADASNIPILIYNFPQSTGVTIESQTIAELASHENIVGVKDSSGNMGALADTINRAPEDFAVMTGNGAILFPSLMMGATGAILAVACAAPRAAVELHAAVRAGDYDRARQLQHRLSPLSHVVTAALSVPGLKAAMEMAGLSGGHPRPPLLPVSESEKQRIKAVMRETGLFPEME